MLLLYVIFALVIHNAFTEKDKYKFKYRLGKHKVKEDVILTKVDNKISNHISPHPPYPYREPESCRDVSKACAYYKEDGWCALRDWKVNPRRTYHVIYACAKTCGFCVEETDKCIDIFRSCEEQKAAGKCNATDPFVRETMRLNCEKTCGYCNESSNEIVPVTKPDLPQELLPLPNELPLVQEDLRRELELIYLRKELCIDVTKECLIYAKDEHRAASVLTQMVLSQMKSYEETEVAFRSAKMSQGVRITLIMNKSTQQNVLEIGLILTVEVSKHIYISRFECDEETLRK
ncbi:hypothetical protein GCK32_011414 [Trichostrongylus colubriformis]|uniref:ShKT domain-containing protein n=1 Tax=Trichostrongylus colubriformis TaxID=6319 RepID=A0AAN8J062_TRICO